MLRCDNTPPARPFLLLFIFCSIQIPAFSQKLKTYDLVKDFKAVPDDKTDNYMAFAKAAETLSKAGGGQLVIPQGKYYIAAYKGSTKNGANNVADILFINCTYLVIAGNNSVIRVNGNFKRTEDRQAPGMNYFYARNNTVCPFKITNCKNVLLKDLVLYGGVDKMTKDSRVVEGECYGVFINDEEPQQVSSKIVLQNITAHHFAADGFLIRCNGRDILMNNCNAYKNARQGLSIVKGSDIRILNSSFDSTGITGAYGLHQPGAGIDIENEFGDGRLNDVIIRNCNFRGNNGFQIVTTLQAHNIIIDSCFISDPTAGYSTGFQGVGMYSLNSTLSNSIIFATIQVDIADQRYTGPVVQQIKNNIIYSGHRAIVSSDFARPVNITDNILVMLPRAQLGEYFPYLQNSNCVFNRNIVVMHADRVMKEANQLMALVQYTKEAREDFWLVNGYTIPVKKQSAFYYLPSTEGTKILKDHFFGKSKVISLYNFDKTHFLSQTQVDGILKTELFSAYKQSSYNPKYMLQSNTVRKYARDIAAAATKK